MSTSTRLRPTNSARLLAALLRSTDLILSCGQAQETDATRQKFRKCKAKAEKGDAESQYIVGFCHELGSGVKKDYVEAYAWFNLAAKKYDRAALDRDDLGKSMSPQQFVDAKRRTKELWAQIEAKFKSGGKRSSPFAGAKSNPAVRRLNARQ
jgi:TPR repeat protein